MLLMTNHLLSAKEVAKLIGFNVDWIYKKIAIGEFPKQIKIGRSSRWSYLEIMQWIHVTTIKDSEDPSAKEFL